MNWIVAWGLALVLPLLVTQAWAEILEGRVIAVADGDTITILDARRQQHRIRLATIDAPEKAQAFGTRSRENLAALTFKKEATLNCYKKDQYGRQVCNVLVQGRDVGLAQIEAGLAWHYRRFEKEQSPKNRVRYAQAA